MEARVVGARTWLHLGPARPPGWGRGVGAQIQARGSCTLLPSALLPASGTVQDSHLVLHPRFPAYCEAGTRQKPANPRPAGRPPYSSPPKETSSTLHHPPEHKELLLVLKACLKRPKETGAPTLDGRGEGALMFVYTDL